MTKRPYLKSPLHFVVLILFAAFLNFFVASFLGRAACDDALKGDPLILKMGTHQDPFRGSVNWSLFGIVITRKKSGLAQNLANQIERLNVHLKERGVWLRTRTKEDMNSDRVDWNRTVHVAEQEQLKSSAADSNLDPNLSLVRLENVRAERDFFMNKYNSAPDAAQKKQAIENISIQIANLSYSITFLRLLILKEGKFKGINFEFTPLKIQSSLIMGNLFIVLRDMNGFYYNWLPTDPNPTLRELGKLGLSDLILSQFQANEPKLD